MNASPDTIRDAICSYAVMLNRSQWLDETKLGIQEAVWARAVKRQPSDIVITLPHFERAIDELVQDKERRGPVTPPEIIELAAANAAFESRIVAKVFSAWEAGDDLLLDEASTLVANRNAHEFHRNVNELIRMLSESVLSDHEVEQMIEAIRAEAEAIRKAVDDTPVPTFDNDDLRFKAADQIIVDWHRPLR